MQNKLSSATPDLCWTSYRSHAKRATIKQNGPLKIKRIIGCNALHSFCPTYMYGLPVPDLVCQTPFSSSDPSTIFIVGESKTGRPLVYLATNLNENFLTRNFYFHFLSSGYCLLLLIRTIGMRISTMSLTPRSAEFLGLEGIMPFAVCIRDSSYLNESLSFTTFDFFTTVPSI